MSKETSSNPVPVGTQNIELGVQDVNKPSNKSSIIVIILVVIVLSVLGTVAAVYFVNRKDEKPSITTVATTSTKEVIEDTLSFDKAEEEADPFNDPGGPFFHDISIAHSTDGLNFEKEDRILIEKASVPDAVLLKSGRIMLYAVDGGGRSNSGLLVGISDDYGETWDFGSLQIEGLSAEVTIAADPEIMLLEDGSFRLYYIGFKLSPGSSPQFNPVENEILSAVSQDGINFTQEEGVRFSGQNATDPDIVKINEDWFMYLSQGPKLIAASSSDAIDFTFLRSIREKGSVSNTVPIEDSKWRQFYCRDGIMSATSIDGLNWLDESGFRLVPEEGDYICDPVPIEIDDGWILIYKIAHSNSAIN